MSDETTPPTPAPSPGETTEPESAPEPEPTAEELFVRRVCEVIPQCRPYSGNSGRPAVEIEVSDLVESMRKLRDTDEFDFAMLCDHTAVDRIADNRFELLYHLYSLTHQRMLLVSVKIPRDNPVVPTLCEIWKIAEWQEREVYDLFGVLYDNHPDLRRVFLEDDWKGFPLRKDYQDEFMIAPEEEQG